VLRDYQSEGIESLRAAFTRLPPDKRKVVLVSPVGSGKTTLASEIARLKVARGKRVLWLTHRAELVDQSAARLEAFGLSVGVISAGSNRAINPHRPVQVASIQTLVSRDTQPPADLIIVDECHHQPSKSWTALLAKYPPETQGVGLTATPERADGKPLTGYEEIITVVQPSELIAAGHMVPCEVIAPKKPLKPGEIAQRPVDAYARHTPGQSALVFSPSIEAAELHCREFNEAGIRAVMVDGSTDRATRRKAVQEFKSGQLPVLLNCQIFTEGTDLPICSAIILARGCGTEGLYVQICGRSLRPYPSKQSATLIDLRGVSHVHGSPTEDREYSLTGQAIRHGAGEPNPFSACRVCSAPLKPGEQCAECGISPRDNSLTVTGDELSKWSFMRERPTPERAKSLSKWMREAAEKGHKPGAVGFKYKAVFGHWPPADVMAMAKKMNQ
jgi:DNA repair protein RadD